MNYSVVWTNRAVRELAAVWLGSDDRDGVTRASDAIERLLANDPNRTGDELFDTVRTVAYGPLGAEFEVIDADRRVHPVGLGYRPRAAAGSGELIGPRPTHSAAAG